MDPNGWVYRPNDPTAGFIRRVSEIEDENENDDEDDI
jgi:hypothetical protein